VVLVKTPPILKEWTYAGFFFNAALALAAHFMVSDGYWPGAAMALTAVLVSRMFLPKVVGIAERYS